MDTAAVLYETSPLHSRDSSSLPRKLHLESVDFLRIVFKLVCTKTSSVILQEINLLLFGAADATMTLYTLLAIFFWREMLHSMPTQPSPGLSHDRLAQQYKQLCGTGLLGSIAESISGDISWKSALGNAITPVM